MSELAERLDCIEPRDLNEADILDRAAETVRRIDNSDQLHDALQLMVDFVGDGCPAGTYEYCMTEARAALKGFRVIRAMAPQS